MTRIRWTQIPPEEVTGANIWVGNGANHTYRIVECAADRDGEIPLFVVFDVSSGRPRKLDEFRTLDGAMDFLEPPKSLEDLLRF